MPNKTTCIGSFPKFDYVPIQVCVQIEQGLAATGADVARGYTNAMANANA